MSAPALRRLRPPARRAVPPVTEDKALGLVHRSSFSTTLALLALAGLASCANPWVPGADRPAARHPIQRANKPSRLVSGNYCGYGTRYGDLSARPVDRLDAACLEHDACFIERRDRCTCNEALVEAAKKIIADPATKPGLRARAQAIRHFFPAATPICSMFPQGIMPPRKQDVLATRYRDTGS